MLMLPWREHVCGKYGCVCRWSTAPLACFTNSSPMPRDPPTISQTGAVPEFNTDGMITVVLRAERLTGSNKQKWVHEINPAFDYVRKILPRSLISSAPSSCEGDVIKP